MLRSLGVIFFCALIWLFFFADSSERYATTFTKAQRQEFEREWAKEQDARKAWSKVHPDKDYDYTAGTRNYMATVPGIRRLYGTTVLLEDGRVLEWEDLLALRLHPAPPPVIHLEPKVVSLVSKPKRQIRPKQDVLWSNGVLTQEKDTDLFEGRLPQYPIDAAKGTNIQIDDGIDLVAGGNFRLVLRKDGTVWGYGGNEYGQLGTDANDHEFNHLSEPVMNLKNVTAISAGLRHAIALKKDGTVWQWGSNTAELAANVFGTIPGPRRDKYFEPEPVQITGLTNIVKIASGDVHNVALDKDGVVWAWGSSADSRLGTGLRSLPPEKNRDGGYSDHVDDPIRVPVVDNIIDIAASAQHTLALRNDGTVWGWGGKHNEQIGRPEFTRPGEGYFPYQLRGIDKVKKIFTSRSVSVLVQHDDAVWYIGIGDWMKFPFAARIPGERGSKTQIEFTLMSYAKRVKYHEFGVYRIDDSLGRIGTLRPGDAGYANAALSPDRAITVFDPNVRYRNLDGHKDLPENRLKLDADQLVAFYMIRHGNLAEWRAKNSANILMEGPVAFFSYPSANPDGVRRTEFRQVTYHSLTFKWDDLPLDAGVTKAQWTDPSFTGVGLVIIPQKVVQRDALANAGKLQQR